MEQIFLDAFLYVCSILISYKMPSFQAEKEEQAAKEIAPAKEFTGPVETAPAPEPGWVNEVESTAVATENWADDVAPPAAAAIPAAGTTQSFQTSGDWAAQVR